MRARAWHPHPTDKVCRTFMAQSFSVSKVSASYIQDKNICPSTKDGHDYTMRSNTSAWINCGPLLNAVGPTNYSSNSCSDFHKTSRDFSNTIPFHLAKGSRSGDTHLLPSIVNKWRSDLRHHFFQVLSRSFFPTSEEIRQCVDGAVVSLPERARCSRYSKSIRCISEGVKGEMKDDQGC
jgi:hypothetical protein